LFQRQLEADIKTKDSQNILNDVRKAVEGIKLDQLKSFKCDSIAFKLGLDQGCKFLAKHLLPLGRDFDWTLLDNLDVRLDV
jgi:hypothetical protein